MIFKKLIPPLLVCIFVITINAFSKPQPAQRRTFVKMFSDTIPGNETAEEKIFERVEIEAAFPGGDKEWRKFLEQNLNAATPVNYGAPAGTYTVILQFVVDKSGKISDIKALTNQGFGMEAEVIRLLKKAPMWNPAIQDGRPVRAYRKQPVTFMVVEEKRKKKRNQT